MMNRKFYLCAACILALFFFGCSKKKINTNHEEHFTDDGRLKPQKVQPMKMSDPLAIKFYVEVSGSMNGFFRANKPTEFKKDLWEILGYYSDVIDGVTILTENGDKGAVIQLDEFQKSMNMGSFVSSADTKIPTMLEVIFSQLAENEVAVLVSDMKYSPVRSKDASVLMTQYSTDVAKIFSKAGKSLSLVGATSRFLDKNGNILCEQSPYYYFIMGKQEQVAKVRNEIAFLLNENNHFVDNIDAGFTFGRHNYEFGIPRGCTHHKDKKTPTFVGFKKNGTITLKIHLENYRWLMANEEYISKHLKINSKYGSTISIGDVKIENSYINKNKAFERVCLAIVKINISNMQRESDVLEWNLEVPSNGHGAFAQFFEDAVDENDCSKSYSVSGFVKGMSYMGVVNKDLEPNYILISKNK